MILITKLRDQWAKRRRAWLLPALTRDYCLKRAELCHKGEAPHEYEGYVDQYGTHWECIWCGHAPEPDELQPSALLPTLNWGER